MPEVKQEVPVVLKPYTFFGVDIEYEQGKEESIALCPFCFREEKFYVNNESGQYHCKTCSEQGNIYTFLKRTWEESRWIEGEAEELSQDKHISVNTLNAWEMRIHEGSEDWVVAGYNGDGKLNNLYRRVWNYIEKRFYFNGPKGLQHGLMGMNLWDQDKDDVFICEGIWDGMILWELLSSTKREDNRYLPTSKTELSLLKEANVICVPSATVFHEYWTSLFAGKRVYLCYDNDHPAKNTGLCGALEGMKHAANIFFRSSDPPKEIHYLKWGEGRSKSGIVGYDPDRKHGYDLRDALTASEEPSRRREVLGTILSMFELVPTEWVEGSRGSKGKPIIPTLQCERYTDVLEACNKTLVMTDNMKRGLAVMLACAACVEIGGDQLWIKFISPPSTGKTTLAEGLVLAKKYACFKSITTGLHSGYKDKNSVDGETDDFSLINMIKNKAVIIKDGDTLLKSDSLDRILSELRDAYDRSSSTHFRNKIIRDYENHSFALLLCGTSALRYLDDSELGQRFIDCVIMEGIDNEYEDRVLDHKLNRFRNLMASQAILNGDRIEGPDRQKARQVIGGYLEYLRRNALYLISEIRMSDEVLDKIKHISKFVALFRGRPTKLKTEAYTREMAGRLSDQLAKLAYGLAIVMQKKQIDDGIMKYVLQCGLDTARGTSLKIAQELSTSIQRKRVEEGRGSKKRTRYVIREGLDLTSISQKVNVETRELKKMIIYMRAIGIVETSVVNNAVGLGSRVLRWKLTDSVKKLYNLVMDTGCKK